MRSSITKQRQDKNRNCAAAVVESTIVSHLFEGQLSYMTLCMHCDHQAYSTQTFTVLSLPIPTDIIKCSIQVPFMIQTVCVSYSQILVVLFCAFSYFCLYVVQDCLSLFFEQTVLTGGEQMLCSMCGLRRETAVVTCLDKPPEILMLHLKRWVETQYYLLR